MQGEVTENRQVKSGRSVFGRLYWLFALLLVGATVVYLFVLMPYYRLYALDMLHSEARTFSQTSVSALKDKLYEQNYSPVIAFFRDAIGKSGRIRYVTVSKDNGTSILITESGWRALDEGRTEHKAESSHLMSATSPVDGADSYEYCAPIDISGLHWGHVMVGVDANALTTVTRGMGTNVTLLFTGIAVLGLLLFRLFANGLRRHLSGLEEVARKMSKGDHTVRANEESPGEIGMLGATFNKMIGSIERSNANLRRIERVFRESDDAILIFDDEDQVRFANRRCADIASLSENALRGRELADVVDMLGLDAQVVDELMLRLRDGLEEISRVDTQITSAAGRKVSVHLRAGLVNPSEQGVGAASFMMLSDITERKRMELNLNELAYRDRLTGLPNRLSFNERVEQLLSVEPDADDSIEGFALLFMDFDEFKLINDTLGHDVGDQLLTHGASRIQQVLRAEDALYRLGGDEFTVILPSVDDPRHVELVANNIIDALRAPFHLAGKDLHIGVSIGVSMFPDDGMSREDLLRSADIAMYAAKRVGGNRFQFFKSRMGFQLEGQLANENQLRAAVRDEKFLVHFQPLVCPFRHAIKGYEALLRWEDEGKLVPPMQFIPVAEKTGLIVDIGYLTLAMVCEAMNEMATLGFDGGVAVNISGRQLVEPDFVRNTATIVRRHGIDASRITLEFTESVFIEQGDDNKGKLVQLKEAGFKLAIDDFGTGYSSLTYLHAFPIDILKVDRSFVSRITEDAKASAIVDGVVGLSHNLGLIVVAEGVETVAQSESLTHSGCDQQQGFLFSRPVPLETVMAQLRDRSTVFSHVDLDITEQPAKAHLSLVRDGS